MPFDLSSGTPVQVDLVQRDAFGSTNRNRFFYRVIEPLLGDGSQNSPAEFAAGFWRSIGPELRAVTHAEHEFSTVKLTELDPVTLEGLFEFEWTIPDAENNGVVQGEYLPPFICFTFRYVRPSLEFRHGYKRFGGMGEVSIDDGAPTSATLASLTSLASALFLPIIGADPDPAEDPLPNPVYAEPVLVSVVKNGEPRPTPLVDKPVTVLYNGIGTQNSRKVGRGE